MNSYLKSIVIVILLFSITEASAQFGLRAKYNMNSFSTWDEYLDQEISGDIDKIFPSSIELGLDYWFRLKEYRIEFMPEVAMGLKSNSQYSGVSVETNFSYFAFNLNTHIYAFDLKGDCDCPTFSKQGPALNKGFFFAISPGLLYNTKDASREPLDEKYSSSQINLRIGLGIGYDIGISDLFTITPIISYHITPGVKYEELLSVLPNSTPLNNVTSGLNQLQFQLRFGFRPDYVKSYGRGRR